jgi:hypothetical protein
MAITLCLVFAPSLFAADGSVVEMKIRRVTRDPYSKSPVVILEGVKESRLMPIWIGEEEARSIALGLENAALPRPLTHDLIRNILSGIGAAVTRVTVNDLKENTYYATVAVRLKGQEFNIDARPSDAIAVAVRVKAPIYVSAQVLERSRPFTAPDTPAQDLRKALGIHAQDLTVELAGLLGMEKSEGVLVAEVDADGPASQAGLKRGDVIVKINERGVRKVADAESLLRNLGKSSDLKLEIFRSGRSHAVAVKSAS